MSGNWTEKREELIVYGDTVITAHVRVVSKVFYEAGKPMEKTKTMSTCNLHNEQMPIPSNR